MKKTIYFLLGILLFMIPVYKVISADTAFNKEKEAEVLVINTEKEELKENSISEKNIVSESDSEKETSDIEVSDINMNYFYVESPYMESDALQNVVVSLGDGTEDISDMYLKYHDMDGEEFEWTCDSKNGELYLFSRHFGEQEKGVYQFQTLTYLENDVEKTIDLEAAGIDAWFGVEQKYEGYEPYVENEAEIIDEMMDASVVVLDEENIEIAEEIVSETLEEVVDVEEFMTTDDSFARNTKTLSQDRDRNIVVAIDPGHGGKDSGAVNTTYNVCEKDLVLKISKYAKEEIEKYSGVEVFMTRETDVFIELNERADLAADAGADILISMHLNAFNGAAYGAEVYYPNNNLNAQIGQEGKQLAEKVQSEILKLGLYDKGVKVRTCVEDKYSDGSYQDYYAMIRNSKLNGFPGIIIEHAFIDNNSDYLKYLNTDEKLKALGIADANGIASYLKLDKSPKTYVEDINPFVGAATIKASGLGANAKVVISNMEQSKEFVVETGRENISFTIKDFNDVRGAYKVESYDSNGQLLVSRNFTIAENAALDISIGRYMADTSSFEVVIKNDEVLNTVKKVQVPVWCSGDQRDIKWYTAEKQDDGSYVVEVFIDKHQASLNANEYQIHVYVTLQDGAFLFGGKDVEVFDAALYNSMLGADTESRE